MLPDTSGINAHPADLAAVRDMIRPSLYQAVGRYPWNYMIDDYDMIADYIRNSITIITIWKSGVRLASEIFITDTDPGNLARLTRFALCIVLPGIEAEEEAAVDFDTPQLAWRAP